jgi:hypothetical protein
VALLVVVPRLLPDAGRSRAQAQGEGRGGSVPGQAPGPGTSPAPEASSATGAVPAPQDPAATPAAGAPTDGTPSGPAPPPPGTNPNGTVGGPTSPSVEETFTTEGGSVRARCTGSLAFLVSWQAADGFEAKVVERGPAAEAHIRFHPRGRPVGVKVRCPQGTPVAQTVGDQAAGG